MHLKHILLAACACGLLVGLKPVPAVAVNVPSSADGSRVVPQKLEAPRKPSIESQLPVRSIESQRAPAEAKKITLELRDVKIRGMTAFSEDAMRGVYADMLGKTVTLDVAWRIAAQITDRYKQAGYFLSRAYVPEQSVEKGVLRITVVEGFVEKVTVTGDAAELPLVKAWSDKIKSYRPITVRQLEAALLEMNGLPDASFRAVLNAPDTKRGDEGAVWLNLVSESRQGKGSVRAYNYGSRYLGPYQLGLNYEIGLLPQQKTNVAALVSAPTDEVKSASLRHTISLAPKWSADVNGSYTSAAPGYLLKVQDIESDTYEIGAGMTYQWLRQRDENLSTRLGFAMRNTHADIINAPLTRDRLRLLRLNAAYEVADAWYGYNSINTTLTQGIDGVGASRSGASFLSRAQAKPNFQKMELTAARSQGIGAGFQAIVSFDGQIASGPMYSSEEFGYGGQNFGRAYDNSEITGDHGAAGALELRYTDVNPVVGIAPMPYVFYDIGKVWNEDAGQNATASGSSAGFGVRARTDMGMSMNMGLAFPLTREASDPIYSSDGSGPRFTADIGYEF
jgi:hemolysin activation/secretion protein